MEIQGILGQVVVEKLELVVDALNDAQDPIANLGIVFVTPIPEPRASILAIGWGEEFALETQASAAIEFLISDSVGLRPVILDRVLLRPGQCTACGTYIIKTVSH